MKRINSVILIISIFCIVACRKDNQGGGIASLNIVNNMPTIPSIYPYFTFSDSAFYVHRSQISFESNLEIGLPGGINPLTIDNVNDTTKALLQISLNLKIGGNYSLF